MGHTGVLLGLAIALYGAQELFRRSGQWEAWACFLAVPGLASAYWAGLNHPGLFAGFDSGNERISVGLPIVGYCSSCDSSRTRSST